MLNETSLAILDSFKPRLVPIANNLTAAVFSLMKITPAYFCIRCAIEDGLIEQQTLVIETSSGNLALGLAIVCNWCRRRLTIVTDYACDSHLRRRLEDLGARVEIVPGPAPSGGYQRARLDRLDEIRAEEPNHWWLNQYDNPGNPEAYGSFAGQLVEGLGEIDCLVGSVGSGGSVCGTAGYLRQLFPSMITLGVDTFGSVLFGQPDQPRKLRGLGNSLLPKNLDHSTFDEVHWVTAAEAFTATRVLHRRTSLFCGGTSGAAWLVASKWAANNPDARVVCIFPDDGYRYLHTIYDDRWLCDSGLWLSELGELPQEVNHPLEAGPNWSWMKWGRRTYEQVMGEPTAVAGRQE
jgi:cysteine synthase